MFSITFGKCLDYKYFFSQGYFTEMNSIILLLAASTSVVGRLWSLSVSWLLQGIITSQDSYRPLILALDTHFTSKFLKSVCFSSVRVSNELGRGSSRAAKFSIKITVLTLFAIGFVLCVLPLLHGVCHLSFHVERWGRRCRGWFVTSTG